MIIIGFLLIAGLAILFWYFSRGGHPEDIAHTSHRAGDSMEIAKRRYARGEITRKRFQEIVEDLKK